MIKGVKFVSIPVRDQDAALEFYTKQLGFKILTDQPFNDEQRWIELQIPGEKTSIVLFTPEEHKDRIGTPQHVTFWSDDVVGTYNKLSASGVDFAAPAQEADWGSFAIFKDLDGNTFVLSSR